MNNSLINQCYTKSEKLLLKNSTNFGILASSKSHRAMKRNYLSIFGRDASICSLGMVLSRNKELINVAQNSLKILAQYQNKNGQIPNRVDPKTKFADFWRIGCIDATLWWLIALDFYFKQTGDKKLKLDLKRNINIAIFWLLCQEHAEDRLIIQNEASDWADIMPRSGKVLYSNALWHKVKILYKIKFADKTKTNINNLLYPFDYKLTDVDIPRCNIATIKQARKIIKFKNHYLSFVNYLFWGNDIDVYGNSLAIIFNLPSADLKETIINYLLFHNRKKLMPIPVLFNPIKKNSKHWREYMKIHDQNFPYQYHNGGIWPFASCFWTMALYKTGKKDEAWKELEKIAIANKINNWEFNEWFHGKTGKPMGMKQQSWNASMFIFAFHYLKGDFKF